MQEYDPGLETDFQKADALISENKFREAKDLLLEVINRDPSYGKAHNHLGWLYYTKEEDMANAEKHYRLALKYAPGYPASYLNYAYLLSRLSRLGELKELLQKAESIPEIDRAILAREWGYYFEDSLEFDKAIEKFKEQALVEYDNVQIDRAKDSIKRCRLKQQILNA